MPPTTDQPGDGPAAAPTEVRAYPWERRWRPFRGKTIRQLADNQEMFDRLLFELEVPPTAVTADTKVKAALDRFCTDVNLNIAYYERRTKWRRVLYYGQAAFIFASASCAILLAVLLARHDQSLTASGIGLVIVAAVSWLQLVTGFVDVKGQWAAFWKASSELKEQLYTFQQSWRGRAWRPSDAKGAGTFDGGFEAALWQEVLNARKRVLAEREAFFGTFKSAGDLVSSFQAVLGGVRGEAKDALASRVAASAPSAQEAKLSELRVRLIEAQATVAAEKARLADLEKTGATPALLATTRNEVGKAEREVVRVEALLAAYARAGVFDR